MYKCIILSYSRNITNMSVPINFKFNPLCMCSMHKMFFTKAAEIKSMTSVKTLCVESMHILKWTLA